MNQDIKSFDHFLDNKIRFGNAQYISFAILSLIDFIDGFEEIIMAILVSILEKEWSLNSNQVMLLASSYIFGVLIGSFITAFFTDKLGRRNILVIGSFFSFLLILITTSVQEYLQMAILRILYGILFGTTLPISYILISEIVPQEYRGRALVTLQLVYIFGVLYCVVCAGLFLESFSEGNWRGILLFNSIPAFLCFLGACFYLKESPRYYITHGEFQKGFEELNQMGQKNSEYYEELTEEEVCHTKSNISKMQGLKRWQEQELQESLNQKGFSGLLQGENLKITIPLWGIFILYNIQSVGIFFLMPFLYNEAEQSFFAMFIAYSAEIPAIFYVITIIDSIRFGGRINVAAQGMLIMLLVNILIYIYRKKIFFYALIAIRFAFRVIWSSLNALPAESYSTVFRSLGVGSARGIGKFSGVFSPFIMFPLFRIDPYLPFIVSAITNIFTLILLYFYPIDLTQQPLDQHLDEAQAQYEQLHQKDKKD